MGLFDFRKRETQRVEPVVSAEPRGEVPAGTMPTSASNFLEVITGMGFGATSSGVAVNTETALGVPAIWTAVNFLSGTLAGLPLQVYRRKGEGRERVSGGLANILHDAINDEMSSFEWRKYSFDQVFTGGRAFTFIERNAAGRVVNLWPLDPGAMTVRINGWRRTYRYTEGMRTLEYEASEIIDLPFMLKSDRVSHRGPIQANRDVIALAIAATEFGSKFFQNGGVPPFAVTGNFQSGRAMDRAGEDLRDAIRKAAKESRQALVLPDGLEIKPIGADAEKSQLVELKRFSIEEIARVYSLPPTFLQDLTHGTFSNTEQQDLHFVKHTLKRWVEQTEQELNLKLFGRTPRGGQYVEFNVDGLLRGDFKTRMDGYAQGIQNAILTPNEVRRRENLPDMQDADRLFIQGATVPIEGAGQQGEPDGEV